MMALWLVSRVWVSFCMPVTGSLLFHGSTSSQMEQQVLHARYNITAEHHQVITSHLAQEEALVRAHHGTSVAQSR
jgi:hypothetical protein